MQILVTGGTGYIGSHTCVELLNAGHQLVIIDNLSNSKKAVLERIENISHRKVTFYEQDLRDKKGLNKIFAKHNIEAVIHFAGLKAVGESEEKPLEYYDNNVNGSLNLFQIMREFAVKNIIFSSSATVYGEPDEVPITEDFPLHPESCYGRTKLMIEEILKDLYRSDENWNIVLLRYFNPVGAHASGEIGEDPQGIPNNLMPFVSQVAVGKRQKLRVFGDDYPTKDGTGVRDYIHVVDLAIGHVKALKKIADDSGLSIFNLGTGNGYSVLEVIKAFEEAAGKRIPFEIVERRPGDIATCFADPTLAEKELGWKTERDILQMCKDAWNWQSQNPNGYEE